ncbi:MAG: CopG family antitoxin [Candidatus Binatota bacterium]
MPKNRKGFIPKHFRTLEAAGEFWDTHDLGDYWDQTEEVAMSFRLKRKRHLFSIEPALARKLHAAAASRGVSPETITNLWLREMLAKERVPRKRGTSSRSAA